METAHLVHPTITVGNYIVDGWRLKPRRTRILAAGGNNTTNVRLLINNNNVVVQQRLLPIKSASKVDVERLMNILHQDLLHVFDDDHIFDLMVYDKNIKFQDPITKFDNIIGYLFYIDMLKLVFTPNVHIHWIKQTGSYEITTRWAVEMTISFLPWKPSLVITGTSVIGINPTNGKFCSHVDYWDSIDNNDYFSLEGFMDIIKQLHTCNNSPELEAPKYQILKRTATYEVRRYSPFISVKTQSGKLARSTGFNDEAGLPDPNKNDVSCLRSIQGGFAAVLKFSGKHTEDIVRAKQKLLRSSLLLDGLKPKDGRVPDRYNDLLGTVSPMKVGK
uniref:uncharacterized protein LOC122597564 n=1 Tax=Erigeron canadensis TaxID=72917 RepID=UPI001CB8FA4E|nr:uncharacterized protein LOC122597564 [Erigeron canadensis]